MNSLLGMLGNGNGNNNMLMKAMSAMLSGQSPQSFLMSLAKDNPQLSGIDFNNLEQTARDLCKKNNVNVDEAVTQIKGMIKK
jgi:hypothetical protein